MGTNRVRPYFNDDDKPTPAPIVADDGGEVSADVRVLNQMTGVIELIALRLTAIESKVDALLRQIEA